MSTGTPAIFPEVTLKYLRFSMSASAIALQQPARRSAPAARARRPASEMSSISTSRPSGVLLEPAQARVGRRPAVDVLLQARDGAVVDDLAVLVAPGRVDDRADATTLRRSRVTIRSTSRVASLPDEPVLEERRDVDQRRGVADRVVLVLVVRLVGARRRSSPTTRGSSGSRREGTFSRVRRSRSARATSNPLPSSASERRVTRELVGARDYKYARALAARPRDETRVTIEGGHGTT